MVIGDVNYGDPTVHAPPWHLQLEEPTALMGHCIPVSGVTCRANTGAAVSPYVLGEAALAALRRSLVPPPPRQQQYVDESHGSSSSSEKEEEEEEEEEEWGSESSWEAYATDEFRMYEFKVRGCRRRRSHNWTECPFAHPSEKAARRDPRRFAYSGEPCPEFRRRGACERGDACDLAHGVFECWLHPARYRTQPCKDGTACRRPVCFFAHTLAQLRLLPPHHHHHHNTSCCSSASKSRGRRTKGRRVFSSPPMSPVISPVGNRSEREEVEAAIAELRLCKSMPSSWKYRMSNAAGFGSSSSVVPSTVVMAPEQYSWCAEGSVEEESAAPAAEISAPNFDWVSDLLQ